jgi:phenylalanyl-tRNA synthetase beta chain
MQFSEAWLRSLVNPALSTAELAHAVTMAGLEVEAIQPAAPPFSRVVVGEILAASKHPDADRLQVCRVDIGGDEPLRIVCGAPNARAGLKTACALVGAELPNDLHIRQAKVRGVESFGMLCSAKELAIAESHEGILELPDATPVGVDLRAVLGLDDSLITLKLTPNRGDCLSVQGVAREVAAITGAALAAIACDPVPASIADALDIHIDSPPDCPIYCGRILRGIDPSARTPDWMRQRLERSGLRAIHPVVDVTNYVLLELGEPMHAFDLGKVDGAIRVRRANPGEVIDLLNGDRVELASDNLVIADREKALALAGIMGGAASAVSGETRDIFLEAAHFAPSAMAGKARRFGLATDSSHRFERGVDPALPARAIERATRLILDICGGQAGPVRQEGGQQPAPAVILFRPERARRVLGVALDDAEIKAGMLRLDLAVDTCDELAWRVTPPSHRFDLALEVDLIEEVARLKGYDTIPATVPTGGSRMRPAEEQTREGDDAKNALLTMGYQEVITYSFISEEQQRALDPERQALRLQNPIASQMGVMRSSLLPGLLSVLRHNLNHGQERMRLFEIGRCFLSESATDQPLRVAGLGYGGAHPEQWGESARIVDFHDVKGDLETLFSPLAFTCRVEAHPALHPGQSARLYLDGEAVGWLGALHPTVVQQYGFVRAPVVFEVDWEAVARRGVPRYSGLSRFPAVRRDIAVIVDAALPAGDIVAATQSQLPPRVTEFALFDLYQGKGIESGKKSLAFRMLLQDTEKTLTDSEIESTVSEAVKFMSRRFGAVLRG